jgi:hypothetical protein
VWNEHHKPLATASHRMRSTDYVFAARTHCTGVCV